MRTAAIAFVVLLAACSPGDEAEPATSTSGATSTTTTVFVPPTGDVARVGVTGLPGTLNPTAAGGRGATGAIILGAVLPGATVIDPVTWQHEPVLVTDIPSVANGGVELVRDRERVTWSIREEATWSDGTPVSGADFAFTLDALRGLTECGGLESTRPLFDLEVDEVEAKSITVTMAGPTVSYENMFPTVLPSHVVDGATVCDSDITTWPVSGAFRVARIGTGEIDLVRNDAYWSQPAALAGVEFVGFDDEAGLMASIEAGDVDVAVVSAEAATSGGVSVQTAPTLRLEVLGFNFDSQAALRGSLVRWLAFRQAVALAVDRETLGATTGWTPVTWMLRGVDPAEPWATDADPEEAGRLLDGLCSSLGRDCAAEPAHVTIVASDFGGRGSAVESVAEDLRTIGIEVDIDIVASSALGDRLAADDWDIVLTGFAAAPGVDAAAASVFDLLEPDGFQNVFAYGGSTSAVAGERATFQFRLFSGQVAASPDRERVRELLGETHRLLAGDVVFVPLLSRPSYTVVTTDALEGVVANPVGGLAWNLAEWSLRTS